MKFNDEQIHELLGEDFIEELTTTSGIILVAFLALTSAFVWNAGPIEHNIQFVKTPLFRSGLLFMFTVILLWLTPS